MVGEDFSSGKLSLLIMDKLFYPYLECAVV